jgi:hypothetical protein
MTQQTVEESIAKFYALFMEKVGGNIAKLEEEVYSGLFSNSKERMEVEMRRQAEAARLKIKIIEACYRMAIMEAKMAMVQNSVDTE